ncbi:TraM recognition site of TraD and TraG [Cnuella takakiae]|uniref:TraM recognition site of TraD and TraG n=1 Tax=Cnuella takakiae TaxID=1302690 RepID=A0A1M5JAY3_9BACT|nr:TraM recognition domain-containing protein [Cnuella takakiae]OLY95600.1 hypothetical protein BUE76_00430 [Cnuella takakiae]SHG37728.1 TraM recognition site of TraD and TraG [Cnuella takakiae]
MEFEEYAKTTLLSLSSDPANVWTVDDAMKGVSIMGGTGSGKTSASGKLLAMKYLQQGWGGLVLCAKTDEAEQWRQYCEDAGRSADYLHFHKGAVHEDGKFKGQEIVFNPIDYEMEREGEGAGETQNIVNIFMNIYRMGNRIANEGDTHEQRFWDTALKRCLSRIIDLLDLAGEPLSYQNMINVLLTSENVDIKKVAQGVKAVRERQADYLAEEENFCLKCLVMAFFNSEYQDTKSQDANAHHLATSYFTQAVNSMGKKTKSIIIESFMGLAEPFLSGLLHRHFSGATNIFPEQTYGHNIYDPDDTRKRVIVLDFAIKEFLDAGIIAQCVFKLMFQQAVERRNVEKYAKPAFLWCDEAQYFINPYDQIFLTTARSSRISTVYLSQNISNYLAVMGSGGDAKARVDSLMGNLSTKVFHANSDAETNEYASRLIGQEKQNLEGASYSRPHFSLEKTNTESLSTAYLPQVQPKEFTVLKSGGHLHNNKVEAYFMVSGRLWNIRENEEVVEKNHIKVTFTQRFRNKNQSYEH